MDQFNSPAPPCGVDQKADVVFRAICAGHRRIGAIAAETQLPRTTVIRVTALLRDLGQVAVSCIDEPEFVPLAPRSLV